MVKDEANHNVNRARWDEKAPIHWRSSYYDLKNFKQSKQSLTAIERRELPVLTGKSLLHLQCHIGLDSLSLAQMGADVTAIDYSGESITIARKISDTTGIKANFIQCDVYDAPEAVDNNYDIVFTSWGVLSWLSDLPRWADVIARSLKPGGLFYMVEFHPMSLLFGHDPGAAMPAESRNYFAQKKAIRYEFPFSYTGEGGELANRYYYQWPYTVGEVVTCLSKAGLCIQFLHEHPCTIYKQFEDMVETDGKMYRQEASEGLPVMPLSFSIAAHKP